MSFDPTKTYRSVLDIDGNIFAFQAGRYYDRYGNSFATLPVNKEGYAPPTDVEITPEFLGDTLVINSDATGAGTDWKYTIARPTSGMTSAQTLTLPTTGGIAARTQDKLSAFAATTSAELAGVISDEEGTSGGFVRATGCALAPTSINGVTTDSTTNKPITAATLSSTGTWTPIIVGSTAAGTGTYTSQLGSYVKIGRLVTLTGTVIWSAHDGTGNMRISDLPYACSSGDTNLQFTTVPEYADITLTASRIPYLAISSTNTFISIKELDIASGVSAPLAIEATGTIYFSITYFAAS